MQPNKHVCMLACNKKACFHAASYIVGADKKKNKRGGGGGGGSSHSSRIFKKGTYSEKIALDKRLKGGETPLDLHLYNVGVSSSSLES